MNPEDPQKPPRDELPGAGERTDIGEFERSEGRRQVEPAHPQRIGRYRILKVLGQGGMGTVYLAEQTEPLRRQVAIKLIRSARPDAQFTHRFEAERQALARMSHPSIAQVYEAGDSEDGQPFFVMEYVPGVSITEYCDNARLAIDERLELLAAVCRGIHHAHQKGILHRDIKPGNILVAAEQGRPVPKIIDFGVAKALDAAAADLVSPGGPRTQFGVVIGTPAYLSPESVATDEDAADPDTRSDVYALGILLFELLVGERPFGRAGESVIQILRQVAENEVPAPSSRWQRLPDDLASARAAERGTTAKSLARKLRGDLDWITLQATARDREMRYDSAAELAEDLDRFRRLEPIQAAPPRKLYVLSKLLRRHRAAAGATVLVLLALAGGIVARTLEARRANREAAAARQAQTETQEVTDFLIHLFKVNDPGATRGSTITARELLDRGAVEIRTRLNDQPLSRARLLDTIGMAYRQLDLPQPAIPLIQGALDTREKLLGPDHPDVATSLNHLGNLYWASGDYPAAERLLVRALALRESIHGKGDPTVAEVLDNLGSVYEIQARYDEARPLLERALEIREAKYGPDSLEVADSLDDLGVLHLDQNEPGMAEPLLRRAMTIREAQLGADSPDVATSANGVAIALYSSGRIEESLAMHQRALAIRETCYGPDSSPVAQSLNNLANVSLDLDRIAEAEVALLRAAAIWEEVLGPDNPRLGTVLFNLGDLNTERGDLRPGEELYRRTARIFESGLGAEHPRLAYALLGLAENLRLQGRASEGLPLCQRALAIRDQALGAGDPETVSTRERCAAWPAR